jgi:hypothetical protein
MDRIFEFVNEDTYIYDKKWSAYPSLFKITEGKYYFHSFADFCCGFLNDEVDSEEAKEHLITIFRVIFDLENVDTVVLDLNFDHIAEDFELDYDFRDVLNQVLIDYYDVSCNEYESTSSSDMTLVTINRK